MYDAGGQLREFTDEESNFAALLQRAMDLEGVDRDVVYQLVALLIKVTLLTSHLQALTHHSVWKSLLTMKTKQIVREILDQLIKAKEEWRTQDKSEHKARYRVKDI